MSLVGFEVRQQLVPWRHRISEFLDATIDVLRNVCSYHVVHVCPPLAPHVSDYEDYH